MRPGLVKFILWTSLGCSGAVEGPIIETEAGQCQDGTDNDGDTLTDCTDPDCAPADECQEEPETWTDPPTASLSFTPSNEFLVNPERGFYRSLSLVSGHNYHWIRDGGYSLAFSYVRLDDYRTRDLDADFLDALETGLDAARDAGIKIILRFSYNFGPYPNSEPDASKAQILRHIDQVEPILREHGDVLAIVEAVAGPGNARVAVNATVDWSATSEVSEVFSPVLDDNGEQLRSAASTVIESDDPTTAEGILGTGDIDTLGVASTVRADVDADFLVDRSVKTVESNGGEVQTLTASVVVDSAAVDPADMATLITLVEAATGLSVENGNLSVAALAFDTTAEQQITAANEAATEAAGVADAAAAQQATMRTGIIAGFAAIAGLLALLSFRRARKSTTTDGAADKLEALLSGETQVLERTAPTADMTALNPGEQLALVSSEHPDDVAELSGSWMTERTAVTQ